MRNSRRLIVAFILATLMSGVALKADTGAPGGPQRGTCGFLQGILYKVGSPAVLGVIFDAMFECTLDW
jgi:hypothetical protein